MTAIKTKAKDKIRLALVAFILVISLFSLVILNLRFNFKKSAAERTPNIGMAVWLACLRQINNNSSARPNDPAGRDKYLQSIQNCLNQGGRAPDSTATPTVVPTGTSGTPSVTPAHSPTPSVTTTITPTDGPSSSDIEFLDGFTADAGSKLPSVLIDSAGKRHYVWWDKTHTQIHYLVCSESKSSCGQEKIVSQNGAVSYYPNIALDANNHPHVVWEVKKSGGGYDIYYSRYDGSTWTSPKMIADDPYSEMAAIRINSAGVIQVVYQSKETKGIIYYIQSSDNGSTWSSHLKLGDGLYPRIALDKSDTAYVVWNGNSPSYAIFYRYKDSAGQWSTQISVTSGGREQISDIRIDTNNVVHVVWGDYLVSKIAYSSFKNDHVQDSKIDIAHGVTSLWPKLDLDASNNVYVVYQGHTVAGKWDIYYVTKTASGWGDPVKITDGSGLFQTPGISIKGANGAIVYYDTSKAWMRPFKLK